MDTLLLAGLERGLTMSDIERMQIGRLVDFVVSFNERQKESEEAQKRPRSRKRKATQADIDAFFG